jgi:signal transduction histidine kinase
MSLVEIFKVVGFATGAALHLYIAWLIFTKHRAGREHLPGLPASSRGDAENPRSDVDLRPVVDQSTAPASSIKSQDRLGAAPGISTLPLTTLPPAGIGFIQSERTFIALGICLGLWFLGNLLITFQEVLLGPGRATVLLRVWNAITVIGISLFPSVLLHAHLAFWSWTDGYRVLSPRQVRLYSWLFYVPMIVLPYAAITASIGNYRPYLAKLQILLIPYSIWFLLATWSSAALDWIMKDRLYQTANRERALLKMLAVLLFANGAFEMAVVGVSGPHPNDFLWITYILLSLLPTFAIAYYIYRYNLYELAIKGSLVYATLAVLFLTVYTYGIRHLDSFLVSRFEIRPGVVEAFLILGMLLVAGPLVRVIDKGAERLFERQIGRYREVVRKVSAPSHGRLRQEQAETPGPAGGGPTRAFGTQESTGSSGRRAAQAVSAELASRIGYTEETIRRGLELGEVKIEVLESSPDDSSLRHLGSELEQRKLDWIQTQPDAAAPDVATVYALRREGKLIGLMTVGAGNRALSAEKRALLEVLVEQVALHVESWLLFEDKVRLERELAGRERLALLGQMATTVAHEVKNPLSSIKSIAQVMREDENLDSYQKDLDLIIGEMDRLSGTVSQLLAFSRSDSVKREGPKESVSIKEIVSETVSLFSPDALRQGIEISASLEAEFAIPGEQAVALREALGNLLLNAIQAAPAGTRVTLHGAIGRSAINEGLSGDAAQPVREIIRIAITDEGPGVSPEVRDAIFEPFFTTKPRGTGLGLSIVSQRVAEMGGSIDVTSPMADGRGARFVIEIPVGR